MVTKNTIEKANRALPYLVNYAQTGNKVTYKGIADKIGYHHRPMRYVLGYIRDNICVEKGYPMINLIVVNGKTGSPGDSCLPGIDSHISKEERERIIKEYQEKVFSYTGWNKLLEELDLTPI